MVSGLGGPMAQGDLCLNSVKLYEPFGFLNSNLAVKFHWHYFKYNIVLFFVAKWTVYQSYQCVLLSGYWLCIDICLNALGQDAHVLYRNNLSFLVKWKFHSGPAMPVLTAFKLLIINIYFWLSCNGILSYMFFF